MRTSLLVKPTDRVTYSVCVGRPSWHQARAGASCNGKMVGFETRESAEAYITRLREHNPNVHAFIIAERER